MALIRSGQKNLDDIQRIRAAMESGSPVVTGAQQELIEKYASLLGEDGRAIIQDIEEYAGKTGKLPADVFRLIDSCLHSLGQRAKRQELSNEVIQEREPERLLQVEAIREHATRLTGARAGGDNTIVESTRQAMLVLVGSFMEAEHFNFGQITNHLLLPFLVFQPPFHPDNSATWHSFHNSMCNFCICLV